ncbi:glycosyltransferase involved in cell wall biosynthesis [Actinoplanes lutulentus]|uniref:4,4'-diaponeurosporenoate glycosyltransferase n=1 Tax=Actinoplanes lutulentus TaxID=1287878 RepID=A0A327ZA26_9ACTN|nr:glycosyltransferase family A protein [Actinoplanes lutulentus]MBB2949034.1 glycosyltransferase involved in cell wall biosynthesis [Actinoplanes lutulentus]RAK31358.1 glycosyl transferase family 2 [Actinoplanes lutulentus]
MARITVVVPAFDEQGVIGPCLDALHAQTEPADEIIVVDNNSADGTVAEARLRGVLVLHEVRQGVQHARNTGFDAATGDLIVRIDADTRLPPDYLAQVRAFFADPAVDAATGPVRYYDSAMPGVVARGDAMLRGLCSVGRSRRLDWVFGANMVIRRTAWQAVSPTLCVAEHMHEDLDLGIHLHRGGHAVHYARILVAETSARRIRSDYRSFRQYLLMTERGYADHLGRGGSYARAWVMARVLLIGYPVMKRLYRQNDESRPTCAARKNPMSSQVA